MTMSGFSLPLLLLLSSINPNNALMSVGIPTGEISTGEFEALPCNSIINIPTFNETNNFSNEMNCTSFAAENFDSDMQVNVPCGKCLKFDLQEGETHVFEGGLNIQGKLWFPPNYKATIEVPVIIVQGELEASSNEIVSNKTMDGLRFLLRGDAELPFYPHAHNKESCLNMFCNIGKKAVVVAGGKLNIHGLSDDCPTWVELLDVKKDAKSIQPDKFPRQPLLPESCGTSSLTLVDDDFEGIGTILKPSLGALQEILEEPSKAGGVINRFLRISRRNRAWQGAFINFGGNGLKECVVTDQPYLIRFKFRLTHKDHAAGARSSCESKQKNCISINMHTMLQNPTDGSEDLRWRVLYSIPPISFPGDGVWVQHQAVVEFTPEDFDPSAFYQMLYFSGPDENVLIDIDDLKITLPLAEQFPDPDSAICENLIINGDAEVDDDYPYPFRAYGNIGSYLSVVNEKDASAIGASNNFFRMTGRNAPFTTIFQDIIKDCIVENSLYKFRMRIRLHSDEEYAVRFTIKTHVDDPTLVPPNVVESVGDCPLASRSSGWVWCERNFLFTEFHANSTKIELMFITEGAEKSDIDYDDIGILLQAAPVTSFILPPEVKNCWGVGAEIIQTSHTLSYKDYNILAITDIESDQDNNTIVTFNTTIAKPTTKADDSRFAVEVALLSRNILIEPKDDTPAKPLHGVHVMIIHTSTPQHIQGLEVRGGGQQGSLGRYPIHYHMCENVEGAVVSRNTIRDSNQRCLVIHGTDNVTVEYNVAFNTFGHCYMIEDGIEQDNVFNFNIGLKTKIIADDSLISVAESDQFASTFWISNPNNKFFGNVAAGGEDTGFWYEFLSTIRGISQKKDPTYSINPSEFKFGFHRSHKIHSNGGDGFKLYPNGFFPDKRAVFEDMLSYRNTGDGVLFHNSKGLGIDGGVFADNRRQIEVDKQSDDVTVTNALLIGFSRLYQLEVEAGNRKSHCPAWRPLVGVQLHSFLRYRDSKGYKLENVTFEDFGTETGCVGSTAIEMDEQLRDGHFDAFSSFYNLKFPEGIPDSEKFNMCRLSQEEMFIGDLVIYDATGDLNPNGSVNGTRTPGHVTANSEYIKAFAKNCTEMEGSCALYCENTCYRAVDFAVWNTPDYDDLYLQVTDLNGNAFLVPGYFETVYVNDDENLGEDNGENYMYIRRRYYSPVLPYGRYTLQFMLRGVPHFPQFIEKVWEDPPECSPYIDETMIDFVVAPIIDECDNVVRNPGGESPDTGGTGGFNYWAHTGGGVNYTDEISKSGDYSLVTEHRNGGWQGIGQFLDIRCLTENRAYEIDVSFRMKEVALDKFLTCNINLIDFNARDICPRISFRYRTMEGHTIGDNITLDYAYPMASTVGPVKADTWNRMYGKFKVSKTMAEATSVFMFVERGRPGLNIYLDDIIIQPTTYDCSSDMPIYNLDFEVADTRFWTALGTTEIAMHEPGFGGTGHALRTTMRKEWWGSMTQVLNKRCLIEGDIYQFSANMLLLDPSNNDAVYNCDPSLKWGVDNNTDYTCPLAALRVVTGAMKNDYDIGSMPIVKDDEWNNIYGHFEVTKEMVEADVVYLTFRKLKQNIDMVIDNVQLLRMPDDTLDNGKLIKNGNFQHQDLRYFSVYGGATFELAEWGYDSYDPETKTYHNDWSLIVKQRTSSKGGMQYLINPKVLIEKAIYRVNVATKLFIEASTICDTTINVTCEEQTPKPHKCDYRDTYGTEKCAIISVLSQTYGRPPLTRVVASASKDYIYQFWNIITGLFQFLDAEINADELYLTVTGPDESAMMVLDNFELEVPDLTSVAPTTSPTTGVPTFIPTASDAPSVINGTNSGGSRSSPTLSNETLADSSSPSVVNGTSS